MFAITVVKTKRPCCNVVINSCTGYTSEKAFTSSVIIGYFIAGISDLMLVTYIFSDEFCFSCI